MNNRKGSIMILLVCMLIIPAFAHVPEINTGNVVEVPDPLKSFAWYGILEGKTPADYYLLEMEAGQELRLSISSPDEGVLPYMAVTGPGIEGGYQVPEYIWVPEGSQVTVIAPAGALDPVYEPFTPMSTYPVSSYSAVIHQTGSYYAVVYGNQGRYILATGYLEEFSALEWILVPVQVVSIRMWQGQSPALVMAPVVLTVLAGLTWLYRKERERAPGKIRYPVWTGSLAGFLYIGTGILMLLQTALALSVSSPDGAATVTVILAVLPVVLGAGAVRIAAGMEDKITLQARIWMLVIGGLGLVTWAGLLAGPLLAIVTCLFPERKRV